MALAYDITFSYNPGNLRLKAHQMTINGKTTGITQKDVHAAGKAMGINTVRINRIVDEVCLVVKDWEKVVYNNHIKATTIDMVSEIIRMTREIFEG